LFEVTALKKLYEQKKKRDRDGEYYEYCKNEDAA